MPPGTGPVRIDAEVGAVVAGPGSLAAYRDACELADDGCLPLTYPHILSAGLHMAMLLHERFPLRMVGLVHIANDIELFRPMPADARLALDCRLESGRSKPRGDEFRMVTEALWNNELAWRETVSFLSPAPRAGRRVAEGMPELPPVVGQWAVPADTGRRYARVSGDWNPIHFDSDYAASTIFGERIAHGILSAGYISAVFGMQLPGPGAIYISQTLVFKAPVKIGDTVVTTVKLVELVAEKKRARFETVCTVNGTPVLTGDAVLMVPNRPA